MGRCRKTATIKSYYNHIKSLASISQQVSKSDGSWTQRSQRPEESEDTKSDGHDLWGKDGKEMDGNTLDSSLKNEGSFESETAYIGGYPGLHQFNGSIMDLFVIGTALSRANIMSVFKGEFINKK